VEEKQVKFLKRPPMNITESWRLEEMLTIQQRRSRYTVTNYVTKDRLKSWFVESKTTDLNLSKSNHDTLYHKNDEINKKIGLYHGDITHLEIDAIVNAANESLSGGGGVDFVVHRNGGEKIREECMVLNGCPTGETRITRGYNLPAKYVLHTVGPTHEDSVLLKNCYQTCLDLVLKHEIKTIAFCGISTGIFGYPLESACSIAMESIRNFLDLHHAKVDMIIFVTFKKEERNIYLEKMFQYFPIVEKREKEKEGRQASTLDKIKTVFNMSSSSVTNTPTPTITVENPVVEDKSKLTASTKPVMKTSTSNILKTSDPNLPVPKSTLKTSTQNLSRSPSPRSPSPITDPSKHIDKSKKESNKEDEHIYQSNKDRNSVMYYVAAASVATVALFAFGYLRSRKN